MTSTLPVDDPRLQDLLRPENLPGDPRAVELRFTHGSLVFLTEESAYKIKRAKDYGFFDYTKLDQRRHYCEEEVRLNRRAAPDVYHGLLPVYRDGAGYSMNRPGEVVDYAVHMRRLPDDRSALAHLMRGELTEDELREIARRLTRFHAEVEERAPDRDALRVNFEENFRQVRPFVGDLLDEATFAETRDAHIRWLEEHAAELTQRPCRDGHGDLRLEHVYFLPGEGVVFLDCIEFLDRFRIADPALDAAFLAMDLCRLDHAELAEAFLASIAYESNDYGLYPLIDGYMSYRALVRAKVAGIVACDPETGPEVAARKRDEATRLFHLAHDLATPRRVAPSLIGVGGVIASGKTTVADLLSRRLHTPVVSGDATRKHMAGLEPDQSGDSTIYGGIYAPEFSTRVHDELMRRADHVLASGRSVILDTTFQSQPLRDRARELALSRGAEFRLVECRITEAEARSRLRRRTGGVSDAREPLLREFLDRFEPFEELPPDEWIVLDTTLPEHHQIAVLESGGVLPLPIA